MIFGRHINQYYWKFAPMLLVGLITLVVEDYIQLIVPRLYQMVINGMNNGFVEIDGQQQVFDLTFLLDKICMPMVGIILIITIGRFLWRAMFLGAAIKVEEGLRNDMFDHARHLSCQYYQKEKIGNLMSLFTNDLDTIQDCFGWGVMMFLDALFLGVLAIYKMWKMDGILTLLSMIPMGLLLASATVVGRYMMKKWDARQEVFSRLSDFSQESFTGIAVIKAFVKEARELLAFRKLNQENERANLEHTRASVLLHILVTLFVESVVCIILGYGGYLVYQGRFNAGQLVEFIGYFDATIWPIMAIAELIDMSSRGRASLLRVSELLDAEQNVVDRPDATALQKPKGEIRLSHLTFTYPDEKDAALQDISCVIHQGEQVGLVGKTGAGKTTLVDLLLKTYMVEDGMIFLDGQDVNQLTTVSVRDAFAYVPQDNFLFSDTIGRNIAFGVTKPSEEKIETAARMADVDENIRAFADGYDTVLGERGITVSGGQKQRISIARALMKEAPILILDDSVSAVDTRTERVILNNLRQLRAGKTTILIAHRISTIEKMDKILFIEEGRLTAVGTHQVLQETCPSYRKMVELQKLEEEREQP
ncbi:MAG: ABC transporter ATP-binding protein [Firmicutes bacterium]|nr:ABC transporter ATP-binding protein [Bacillota bacterium]